MTRISCEFVKKERGEKRGRGGGGVFILYHSVREDKVILKTRNNLP